MFIERNLDLAMQKGMVAMITMQSWMFLSSYEKLRERILNEDTILSMAHLGARAFDSIGGEVVSTTAFVIEKSQRLEYKGAYLRLVDGNCEADKDAELRAKRSEPFCVSAADFKKIPGSPIAYWASNQVLNIFSNFSTFSTVGETREGLTTGSNDLFLRLWHEVSLKRIGFKVQSNSEAIMSGCRWFGYIKGGDFRKWSGNSEFIVNWENDGESMKIFADPKTGRIRSAHNYNGDYAFRSGLTWSGISSGDFAVRHVPEGYMFDAKGPMGFPERYI